MQQGHPADALKAAKDREKLELRPFGKDSHQLANAHDLREEIEVKIEASAVQSRAGRKPRASPMAAGRPSSCM
jgi:hypothetical protein